MKFVSLDTAIENCMILKTELDSCINSKTQDVPRDLDAQLSSKLEEIYNYDVGTPEQLIAKYKFILEDLTERCEDAEEIEAIKQQLVRDIHALDL